MTILKSPRPPRPPRALRGFSGIDRYWDPHLERHAAKILPGEFYVTNHDEVIVTVLGSCVSACIRDPESQIGGMNHFMLPGRREANQSVGWNNSEATRYGVYAMEKLINEILKHGGDKHRLETKIFGAGRILATMTDIGAQNVAFVRDFLSHEDLPVMSEDLGSTCPRKVYYFPRTGKVRLKRLDSLHNDTIQKREIEYQSSIGRGKTAGEVELF